MRDTHIHHIVLRYIISMYISILYRDEQRIKKISTSMNKTLKPMKFTGASSNMNQTHIEGHLFRSLKLPFVAFHHLLLLICQVDPVEGDGFGTI